MLWDNVTQFRPTPRLVRPAPSPLGLYFRPARSDHKEISNFLAAGNRAFTGAVFDPTLTKRHGELREQLNRLRLETILDPKTQQSALHGSYTDELGKLLWGVGRMHIRADFGGQNGRLIVEALGNFAIENGFTQVVAATHLLSSADDPWLQIDIGLAQQFRNFLDRSGARDVSILYSLAITYRTFRDRTQRRKIMKALVEAPIDMIWLKIDGLGSNSSAHAFLNYIEAAAELHEMKIPVVADCIGGLFGLSLLALGSVGGIAHGVTLGERFDAGPWRKFRNDDGPFGAHRRVYFPSLDLMLKPKDADLLLRSSARARSLFGCNDNSCCPRGVVDMLQNPGRHFLYRRMEQVAGLAQIPNDLRPERFLDRHLRPATDSAVSAAASLQNTSMAKKTLENRKRLDALRIALSHKLESDAPQSYSLPPMTRAARGVGSGDVSGLKASEADTPTA